MSVIADTSGLIALLDHDNAFHQAARPYYQDLIVPGVVLAEFDYLATRRVGARIVRDFYRSVESGFVTHVATENGDLARAFEILDTYQDANIGLVDATIVATAERYQIRRILTLDRRHFTMFRPQGLDYLELLP